MAGESRCVYCRQRRVEPAWRPFCSERCKMADLGRWLQGHYKVPGPPIDTAESNRDDEHAEEDDDTPPL